MFIAVKRLLTMQMLMITTVTMLAWGVGDARDAKSAFAGALVGFLPNLYFGLKVGRRDLSKNAKEILHAFYMGESVKFVLTALLFALVFHLPGMIFLPLFAGFIAVIGAFWVALLLTN